MKSVLLVGEGEDADSLAGLLARLAERGWICGRAPDLASALVVLHGVRPAVVLATGSALATDGGALRRLRRDPFMSGVPVVGVEDPSLPPGAVDALIPAGSSPGTLAERLEAVLREPVRRTPAQGG